MKVTIKIPIKCTIDYEMEIDKNDLSPSYNTNDLEDNFLDYIYNEINSLDPYQIINDPNCYNIEFGEREDDFIKYDWEEYKDFVNNYFNDTSDNS